MEENKRVDNRKEPVEIKLFSLMKIIVIMVGIILFLVTIIVIQQEKIQSYDTALQNVVQVMDENRELYSYDYDECFSNGDSENSDIYGQDGYNNELDNADDLADSNDESNLRVITYFNEKRPHYTAKDSKLDYDILYMGMPISENVGIHSIDNSLGIDDTEKNRKHYTQEYYSYKSDGFMRIVKTPEFVHPELGDDREKYFTISNTSTLAVSKNYDLMPRTINYYFEENGEFFKKVESYYEGKNLVNIFEPSMLQVDLNGDGNYLYLKVSVEKVAVKMDDYEKKSIAYNFDAFDKNGSHLDTLLTVISNTNIMEETLTSFDALKDMDSVVCADLDNDSKMELMIEAPWYEFGFDVYTYKYENGKMIGETGAIHYAIP